MAEKECGKPGCQNPRVAGYILCEQHSARRPAAAVEGMGDDGTCAIARCDQPRVPGPYSSLCEKHLRMGERELATRQRTPTGPAAILCPHCQTRGKVTTKSVKVKRGISGGKATGALLTGGISMLATGLSRKESVTEMHCGNCRTTWRV